jgi:hypothetical protein
MRRIDLEHIIRASGAITGAPEIVIVGSQSILGQIPNASAPLLRSMEADVFTFRSPDDALLIDGTIGELTAFHQTFGYHAHGVGIETAILPDDWRTRLVTVCNDNTRGVIGLCLEVNDLCVSKIIAGREKDIEFVKEAILRGYAKIEILRSRLHECGLPNEKLQLTLSRLTKM